MKECSLCQETKPLDAFHKLSTGKYGRHARCKDCRAIGQTEYNKGYYSKNREVILARQKAYSQENKAMISAREKDYRENNQDRILDGRLRCLYNISLEQYNLMLEQQNYVCAICSCVNQNGKSLNVDHDHNCCPGSKSCGKCVRKLLCHGCNILLGNAKDSVEILKASIAYLEEHSIDHIG